MKALKLLCTALSVVLFCVLFSSCAGSNENSFFSLSDNYYIYSDFTSYPQTIKKMNLTTGEITPLCTDPLCTHDTDDCLFYEAVCCVTSGNTVFFTRSKNDVKLGSDGIYRVEESICSYDYDTGEFKILCSFDADNKSTAQGRLDCMNGYVYFYRSNPDTEFIEFKLYRVPESGGKITDLDLSVPWFHSKMFDGRIYFNDNVSVLYSTDELGGDKRIIKTYENNSQSGYSGFCDGKVYITNYFGDRYEFAEIDTKTGKERVRYTLTDGKPKLLVQTDDGIYFTIENKSIEEDESKGNYAYTEQFGGKIYRLDKNDKVTTVFDDPSVNILTLASTGKKIVVTKIIFGGDKNIREMFVLD